MMTKFLSQAGKIIISKLWVVLFRSLKFIIMVMLKMKTSWNPHDSRKFKVCYACDVHIKKNRSPIDESISNSQISLMSPDSTTTTFLHEFKCGEKIPYLNKCFSFLQTLLLYNKWVIMNSYKRWHRDIAFTFSHIVIGFSLIKFNALHYGSMHSMTRAFIRQILFIF